MTSSGMQGNSIHVKAIAKALSPDIPIRPAQAAEILWQRYRQLDPAGREAFVSALIVESAARAALNRNLELELRLARAHADLLLPETNRSELAASEEAP